MDPADARRVDEGLEAMLWRHGSAILWVVGLAIVGAIASVVLWGSLMLTFLPLLVFALRGWGERRAYQLACRFLERFGESENRDAAVALLIVKQHQVYGATLAAATLLRWIGRRELVDAPEFRATPKYALARVVDVLLLTPWLYRSAKLPSEQAPLAPSPPVQPTSRRTRLKAPIPLQVTHDPPSDIELRPSAPASQSLEYIPLDPKKDNDS